MKLVQDFKNTVHLMRSSLWLGRVFVFRCYAVLMSEEVATEKTIQDAQGKIVERNGVFVWTGNLPDFDGVDLIEKIREERIDSILENI